MDDESSVATTTTLSQFPKATLQYEGDDDVDAMSFFLEFGKYGPYNPVISGMLGGGVVLRDPQRRPLTRRTATKHQFVVLVRVRRMT